MPAAKPNILKPTIENLAHHVAASRSGRLSPNELIPLLPVSLSMIDQHLDEMVDNDVVRSDHRDGFKIYEFTELLDAPPKPTPKDLCAYCGDDIDSNEDMPLCFACADSLNRELLALAETNAWPAEAVWQHELLYITATAEGPIRVADIAGRSRMTLSQVKARLQELAGGGHAARQMDFADKTAEYRFPPIRYRRNAYLRHDRFIRLHPSSLKDEIEVKIIKSLLALIGVLLAVFLLCFVGKIPFILQAPVAAVAGFFLVWRVFKHKTKVEPGRIGRD